MIDTEVCIIGAGPGGAATALKLSYLGVPSVLVDKAVFPRDKICGDAISGKVITLLKRLDPKILQRLDLSPIQVDVWGIQFYAPNHKKLSINYNPISGSQKEQAPGYVSKRIDFDDFLISEVKRRSNINLLQQTEITAYEYVPGEGFLVTDRSGRVKIKCRLLIMANGAQSAFSRKYAGLEKDPKHNAAAVRAYYKNVTWPDNQDKFIELHFIKSLIPGYFWIFPLPNGMANVGVGMRTDHLNRKKVNLKKALHEIVQNHPVLKHRFANAELHGKIVGYGLPLGSKSRHISGDHFMLVGDAAYLVDPLTGEGIGNAFYSGFIAAEQAVECLRENNFSADFLKDYDKRVQRVLGSEMKLSYRIQKSFAHPWVCNLMASIIAGNQRFYRIIADLQADADLRESLVKPSFWLKLIFSSNRSSRHTP